MTTTTEIATRFDRLDEQADQIIAAVAEMKEHVTPRQPRRTYMAEVFEYHRAHPRRVTNFILSDCI